MWTRWKSLYGVHNVDKPKERTVRESEITEHFVCVKVVANEDHECAGRYSYYGTWVMCPFCTAQQPCTRMVDTLMFNYLGEGFSPKTTACLSPEQGRDLIFHHFNAGIEESNIEDKYTELQNYNDFVAGAVKPMLGSVYSDYCVASFSMNM